MPRCNCIGFAPAVTFLTPSRKMACASTVAVVVPSPAMSLVFVATSLTICAPMFSYLSLSSISFATVTPSFVMVGEPHFLPSTTFRPFGQRHAHRVRQNVHALEHRRPRVFPELQFLSSHFLFSS